MGIKPKEYFYVKDGTIVRNLFELAKVLDKIPEDAFKYHVNENKNDFYNWVNDVVKDKDLAVKIKPLKNSRQMERAVAEKIQTSVLKNVSRKRLTIKQQRATRLEEKSGAKIVEPRVEVKPIGHSTRWGKLYNFFFTEESRDKRNVVLERPYVNPKETRYGIECPYKTYHCGVLEFVFGIIVGLLIALLLSKII